MYSTDFLLSIKSCIPYLDHVYQSLDKDWYSFAARLYMQMITEKRMSVHSGQPFTCELKKYMSWVFLPIFEMILCNICYYSNLREPDQGALFRGIISLEGLFEFYVEKVTMRCQSFHNHLKFMKKVFAEAFVRRDDVSTAVFNPPVMYVNHDGIIGQMAHFVNDCRSTNYLTIFEQILQCEDPESRLYNLPNDLLVKVASYLMTPTDEISFQMKMF